MRDGENSKVVRHPSGTSVFQVLALVLLFSAAAVAEAQRLSALHNPDVWLHLRIGDWILANKTWPATGLFSQAASLPWRDFSWAPDAMIAVAYRILGLRAVPALWMIYRLLLAAIFFLLAGGSRHNFWLPAVISALAQYLLYDLGPISAGISTVLFAVELFILAETRRTKHFRLLWLLPPLFVVWANADLGFIYGIALLVLFLAALAVGEASSRNDESKAGAAMRTTVLPLGACLLATLVSPYGYNSYCSFFAIQASSANGYLATHTAMTFRQPQDYVLLLLVMSAFLSLGMRRSRDLFFLPMLIACTALSFRARGGNWLAVIASLAVLGDAFSSRSDAAQEVTQRRRWTWQAIPAASALAIIALCLTLLVPRERSVLIDRIAADFPVHACEYIREHQLPAPLFNSYQWGGFVIWYLPEYPVAIDARRGLYPDEMEKSYFEVMQVLAPYQSFAPMAQAHTLLLDKQNVMAEALRTLPGFRVAYEDDISVVLVQEKRD